MIWDSLRAESGSFLLSVLDSVSHERCCFRRTCRRLVNEDEKALESLEMLIISQETKYEILPESGPPAHWWCPV